MKIALVKRKTGYNVNAHTGEYFDKIRQIHDQTNAGIIVGPELAVANATKLLSVEEFRQFSRDLQNFLIDAKSDSLVIPGTGLVYDLLNKEMFNRALAVDNSNLYEVDKKTSDREDSIALDHGLDYKRGSDTTIICYDKKDIGIEVCRDHGHARLKTKGVGNLDLQLILACNLNGISLEKTVVKEGGIVALVDGNGPKVSAYRNNGNSFEEINGQENGDYLLIEC